MKYSVKQIDGEWCVVDKDTDDIVADATDRKDAVLQASALNREESNSESKPKFHRGSSYGNKPEAEESQEINELSKKTLGSYVKNASADASRHAVDARTNFDRNNKRSADQSLSNNLKRVVGISKAVNKLTKESEEVEIDEAGRTPKEVDEVAVRELVLYAENDADLYRQSALPIIANLQRKVKKGTYDAELAIKLWRYHADRAAKKYIQEFDGEFSPATRNAAAKEFRDGYDEEVQSVLDESSIEEANRKEQLTPELAKGILNDLEIEGKDFFTLSSSKVHELLDVAKQYGYKKSKNAPGSTARMFHQYIQRLAKKAKGEEINELSKDTLGSYVKKAAFDNGMAGFRQGKAVGDAGKYHKRPDNATANAEAKRGEKRMKGIDRAVKKLTNESQEEINESFEKKMTREIAQKIIRADLGISNYTHDYQFTQLSLDQIMKLSKLAKEYGFKLDRMAPLSLEATFWKSLQYVIKTGRSIGGNNENESREEIKESLSLEDTISSIIKS